MSVTRIEEALQPAVIQKVMVQKAMIQPDAASGLNDRLQSLLKRIVTASAEAADLLVELVTPASLVVAAMGLWRLTADLGWTETFPISSGFFSHWQVWIALAAGLKFGVSALAAKAAPEEASQPSAKTDRPA
jgi:hypothetical protein